MRRRCLCFPFSPKVGSGLPANAVPVHRTQEAYEKAIAPLFRSLDRANAQLASQAGPCYFGSNITEADIRLYTTIVRFDAVYVQHFKCNIKDIRSGFPALHKWVRKLYWEVPAFKDTTVFGHIKASETRRGICNDMDALTFL